MATTTQVAFCPRCNAELPDAKAPTCPGCKAQLAGPTSEMFGVPDYIWSQYSRSVVGTDTRPADSAKTEAAKKELVLFARQCLPEDRIDALQDARLLLANAVYSRISADELSKLTILGKQIGKLAESIENFFRHGGELYDREAGRIQAFRGDDLGSDEAVS